MAIDLDTCSPDETRSVEQVKRAWWCGRLALTVLLGFMVVCMLVIVATTLSFRSSIHRFSGPVPVNVQLGKGEQVVYYDLGSTDVTFVRNHVKVRNPSGVYLQMKNGSSSIIDSEATAGFVGLIPSDVAESFYAPVSGRYVVEGGGNFGPDDTGLVIARPLGPTAARLYPAYFCLFASLILLFVVGAMRRLGRRASSIAGSM